MSTDEHYTAHLKIERVTKSTPAPTPRGYSTETPPPIREVTEVLSLTVRAATQEALQAKIRAHLEVS